MSGAKPSEPRDHKRLLLGVLVVVAVVAIPGRLAWSMRSDSLTKASETRDEVRRLDEQIAQARRDKARAADLNDQLQALSAALPSEPDLASVVEQLQAVAQESNVSFVSAAQAVPNVAGARAAAATDTTATTVATGKASSSTTLPSEDPGASDASTAATSTSSSFTVEIDANGTATNLAAFVEKLRSLPRVLTVERLAWTWQDGTTGAASSQSVAAHFSIRAYTWAGATKALAGAAPVAAAGPTTAPTAAPSIAGPAPTTAKAP